MMTKMTATEQRHRWLAISWFPHRRLKTLCAALQIPSIVLSSRRSRLLRYLLLSKKTVTTILSERPTHLIVQNPSIGLALVALCMRPLFGFYLIVDAHNEAISPFIHNTWIIRFLASWIMRHTDLTLVTNNELARIVEHHGGRPFVLVDCIPNPPRDLPLSDPQALKVVLICTFAPDEPIASVMEAARSLGHPHVFYVTGRATPDNARRYASAPSNVVFTGYLDDEDYWRLLSTANVVIDLTEMPFCLVCGAYEALSVARPLVVSDDPALRYLLQDAAIYTNHDPQAIAGAISAALSRQDNLSNLARARSNELQNVFRIEADRLVSESEQLRLKKVHRSGEANTPT